MCSPKIKPMTLESTGRGCSLEEGTGRGHDSRVDNLEMALKLKLAPHQVL